jgi:catechol 2,3-dioxygenase-like lactoylglutathione lyase family enzyme
MAQITGIHHVAANVHDFVRSLQFYTGVLGFTVKVRWTLGDGSDAAMLDTGDGNYLELFGRPNHPAINREGSFIHLALRTDDVDAMLAKAVDHGCEVTVPTKDVTIPNEAPGEPEVPVRLAFFKGPDGEVIELFKNDVT